MVYVKQHNVHLSTISNNNNNNKKKKKIYNVHIVMNHESVRGVNTYLDRVITNLEYSEISTKIEDSGNS